MHRPFNSNPSTIAKMTSNYNKISKMQHKHLFADIVSESHTKLMPTDGIADQPLVSLEEAVEPLVELVHDVKNMATWAKQQCENAPEDHLTLDQSAAIVLYSAEWSPHDKCLYVVLNATLRAERREGLKPWFLYLKLFLTALSRLPPVQCTVYRGIRGDLSGGYAKKQTVIWWSFSSCTRTMDVLQHGQFLGSDGPRTLFTIECVTGRDIRKHSAYPEEDIVLLPAACQFEVVSCLRQAGGLCLVQLKETKSKFPLGELVSEVSEGEGVGEGVGWGGCEG